MRAALNFRMPPPFLDMLGGASALVADLYSGARGAADVDPTAQPQQVPARLLREPVPALVGAAEQGHVRRALEVRVTRDPRATVRGPLIVGGAEGLKP
jgi:hypothetical protein